MRCGGVEVWIRRPLPPPAWAPVWASGQSPAGVRARGRELACAAIAPTTVRLVRSCCPAAAS
eukprot:362855-Chlamydomonas_euryale.AAC.7